MYQGIEPIKSRGVSLVVWSGAQPGNITFDLLRLLDALAVKEIVSSPTTAFDM
jgi:hypothetical protein